MGRGRRARKRLFIDLETCAQRHVTIQDVAVYWNVSITVVRRDVRKGALPFVRVGSKGAIRVPIDAARTYGRTPAA